MLVSYSWLQKYFKDPLPGVEKVVEALTFGVAEVDGTEEKEGDTIIDVKVLPDRASYLLSHRGIASEISVLLEMPMQKDPLLEPVPGRIPATEKLRLEIENSTANPVHALALIEGVVVGPSPVWLKNALEALGQRSINNIVDATNYILLDLGQPTHAFDADKLSEKDGTFGIRVRSSQEGEKITLLGGTELTLPAGVEMLCDVHTGTPLDIAGIKGGIQAELTSATTRVLVTAAKFDPALIRKTATKLGIKTDAVKRFENTVPDELPLHGIRAVVDLIIELAGGKTTGYVAVCPQEKIGFKLGVSTDEVNRILGTAMSDSDVSRIITAFGWHYTPVQNPRAKIVEEALKCVGAAYKADSAFRSDAPHMFSCSSLTNYVAVRAGISMPSVSVDQYVWGTLIEEKDAEAGDLVFANTGKGKIWKETFQFLPGTPVPEGVDHVGVYLGEGKVLHATREHGKVVIENVHESPSFKTVVGYRRVTGDTPRFVVDIPWYRLDVRIREDFVEEIARVYGYGKLAGVALPDTAPEIQREPTRAQAERIREELTRAGFSEIMTYTLRAEGKAALANPLASDKAFLRKDLTLGIEEAIEKAEYNLPLTGMRDVRVFEIGTVFDEEREYVHVCVGVRASAGKKRNERSGQLLEDAEKILQEILGTTEDFVRTSETIEARLSSDTSGGVYPVGFSVAPGAVYTPLSSYPFVLRDIALWVPEGVTAIAVEAVIRRHAGALVHRIDLFDEFHKETRTSYAFHLVFQASDKTLSDEEVCVWMDAVYEACTKEGWETR